MNAKPKLRATTACRWRHNSDAPAELQLDHAYTSKPAAIQPPRNGTSEPAGLLCVPDVEAIMADIKHMGSGLVQDVVLLQN